MKRFAANENNREKDGQAKSVRDGDDKRGRETARGDASGEIAGAPSSRRGQAEENGLTSGMGSHYWVMFASEG
jgi:hypothetical protein